MTPYPYPVIVLPGIMGSALRDEYPVSPETVWTPFKLVIKAYDRITAHPDNTRFELVEPARVVKDQLFAIAYSEFVEELRHDLSPQADQPVPVFPFAYDWRQRLEGIQEALDGFIDEVIDRTKLLRHYHKEGYGTAAFPGKVNLVGHSMGGLIIAGYLKDHGDAKVAKVATIASPFRGSLEAIAKVRRCITCCHLSRAMSMPHPVYRMICFCRRAGNRELLIRWHHSSRILGLMRRQTIRSVINKPCSFSRTS